MQLSCILEPPKPDDAVFDIIYGGAKKIAGVSKNWQEFLPVVEKQSSLPFCVSFSRDNCAETKSKKEGININLSDRHLAVISGTNQGGNSLNNVAEAFRKQGIVAEEDCPFVDDWNQSFKLPNLEGKKIYKGGNHSWVYGGVPAMKQALEHSPLQFAVAVGETWENNVVTNPKTVYGYHAITCYYIDENYYYIFDSIGKPYKKLSLNYSIQAVKSFADLPANWKELNNAMYILKRSPEKNDEIYAFNSSCKRHVANELTLILGAQELDKFWQWYENDTIPVASSVEWSLPTAPEIQLQPADGDTRLRDFLLQGLKK